MRFLLLILIFAAQNLSAQVSEDSLLGLWVVTEVTVGERAITPIAKWAEFKPDHRHRGGNGWTQHTVGEWEFDPETALLEIGIDNGIADEFGPFHVSFSAGKMHWQREEEGMTVQVTLERTEDLPQAHGDKITGLWMLESQIGDDMDDGFFEPGKLNYYFRWDRRFNMQHGNMPLTSGLWYANPHRSELELWSWESGQPQVFQVSFPEGKMVLEMEENGKKLILTFRRIHAFPGE